MKNTIAMSNMTLVQRSRSNKTNASYKLYVGAYLSKLGIQNVLITNGKNPYEESKVDVIILH